MPSEKGSAGLVKTSGLRLAFLTGAVISGSLMTIAFFTLKVENLCIGICATPPPAQQSVTPPTADPVVQTPKAKPTKRAASNKPKLANAGRASTVTSRPPTHVKKQQPTTRDTYSAQNASGWSDSSCVCAEADLGSEYADTVRFDETGWVDEPLLMDDESAMAVPDESVALPPVEADPVDSSTYATAYASASASGSASVSVSGSAVVVTSSNIDVTAGGTSCASVTVNGVTTQSGDC